VRFFRGLGGYGRTLWNYLHTEKGRHDAVDDAKAFLLIAASIWLVWQIVMLLEVSG